MGKWKFLKTFKRWMKKEREEEMKKEMTLTLKYDNDLDGGWELYLKKGTPSGKGREPMNDILSVCYS